MDLQFRHKKSKSFSQQNIHINIVIFIIEQLPQNWNDCGSYYINFKNVVEDTVPFMTNNNEKKNVSLQFHINFYILANYSLFYHPVVQEAPPASCCPNTRTQSLALLGLWMKCWPQNRCSDQRKMKMKNPKNRMMMMKKRKSAHTLGFDTGVHWGSWEWPDDLEKHRLLDHRPWLLPPQCQMFPATTAPRSLKGLVSPLQTSPMAVSEFPDTEPLLPCPPPPSSSLLLPYLAGKKWSNFNVYFQLKFSDNKCHLLYTRNSNKVWCAGSYATVRIFCWKGVLGSHRKLLRSSIEFLFQWILGLSLNFGPCEMLWGFLTKGKYASEVWTPFN